MPTLRRLIGGFAALGLAVLLGGMAVCGGAIAAGHERALSPRAGAYTQGLLWKIERPGQAPSHLFGTIHLADPRVTQLPPAVQKALDSAASLTIEVVFDLDALAHAQQAMLYTDEGGTLEDAIGPDLYTEVRRAFAERGLPAAYVAKLKPWAAAVVLSLPALTAGAPLDVQLQLRAAAQGKPVHALETAQEQIAVFDDLSLADQRVLLEESVREHRNAGKRVEALLQAYLARDLARLQQISEAQAPAAPRLRALLTQRLLTERNQRMVERMRARLREGNAFIAVGAAHLPGGDGLLELLDGEGYRVQAVY